MAMKLTFSVDDETGGREMDIAIAACAIVNAASLWTLNPGDFPDIPGLTLVPRKKGTLTFSPA